MRQKTKVSGTQSRRLIKYVYPLAAVVLVVCVTLLYVNFGNYERSHADINSSTHLHSGLKFANGDPGGISSNLLFWLKADTGWTSSTWNDMSGNGDVVYEIGDPQYVPGDLNFGPGIFFDGNDAYYVDIPEFRFKNGDHHITIITVYWPTNTSSNQGVIGAMHDEDESTIMLNKEEIATGQNGKEIDYDDMFIAEPRILTYIINEKNEVTDPDAPNQGKSSRVYVNGSFLDQFKYDEKKDDADDDHFYIGKSGAHSNSAFLDEGYIYEVIVYENSSGSISIDFDELMQIQSYLSIKYGITPDHGISTASGVLVWDTASISTYHNYVAGLARDDASGLYKDTAQSWQSDATLKVMAETVIDDEEYLIWGSNGFTSSSSVYWSPPPGIVNYLHRQWKFAAYDGNGSDGVGNVSLEFDLSGMTISDPNDLAILVDSDDGDLSNAAVLTDTGVYNATTQKILFSGITINDGSWITIGSKSGGNGLPIELIDFWAVPESDLVKLGWSTAAEVNNDYFTVERTIDMETWQEITTLQGAGNSTHLLRYNAIDDDPLAGISYYRLKQTDFNGEFSYSDVVNIKRTESVNAKVVGKLKLYPNPATSIVNLELTGQDISDGEISIINTAGQLLYNELVRSPGSTLQINIDDLLPGLYYITLTQSNDKFTEKLIVR